MGGRENILKISQKLYRQKLRPEEISNFTFKIKNDKILQKSYWPILHNNTVILQRLYCLIDHTEFILSQTREKYHIQFNHLNKQWKEIRQNGITLKNNLKNFDKFVMENMDKKIRSESRITEQIELRKKYEIEVNQFQTKIINLRAYKTNLEEKLKVYIMYQQFMTQFTEENTTEFRNPMDVIESYELLREFRRSLIAKEHKMYSELQMALTKLERIKSAIKLKHLEIGKNVGILHERFNIANNRCKRIELLLYNIKARVQEQRSEFRLVRSSITNTYRLICKVRRTKPDTKATLEDQLIVIKRNLQTLQNMINDVMKKSHRKLKFN